MAVKKIKDAAKSTKGKAKAAKAPTTDGPGLKSEDKDTQAKVEVQKGASKAKTAVKKAPAKVKVVAEKAPAKAKATVKKASAKVKDAAKH